MNEDYKFDPTTGELNENPTDSGITQIPEEERSSSYIERVLSNTLRISILRVTNSGIYKFAEQSFSFSIKFKITKEFVLGLMTHGTFGIVIMIFVIPVTLFLDIAILIIGISLGIILSLLIIIAFFLVFIFLFFKSLFNL